jgi:hypothetical protein
MSKLDLRQNALPLQIRQEIWTLCKSKGISLEIEEDGLMPIEKVPPLPCGAKVHPWMQPMCAKDTSGAIMRILRGDYFWLIPRHAQECAIEVAGSGTKNGAKIHLWGKHNGDNQLWRWVHFDAEGFGFFEPKHCPGKYLNIASAAIKSPKGTSVHLWEGLDNNARWMGIDHDASGFFRLCPKSNTKTSLNTNGGKKQEATFSIWTDKYANSMFKIEFSSTPAASQSSATSTAVQSSALAPQHQTMLV